MRDLKLISGNDEVLIMDEAGSIGIEIRPWRGEGAAADLDAADVVLLREWLDAWLRSRPA